ncbi:hypothetical protein PSHT_14138 [Puccinia striiformis]|uniref:Fucosyltransferase n=1 Tax=Puccinia striiformis TaxID=27350 RepID=A0A2S4ULK6_9BASI|nr:hypothetical protein PSHT_14138 [Puccinia striiformis]
MKDPKAFDFEVTYKTSSDFPIPYAYGFIDFRKASLAFEARRQDKIAAAFISNCGPLNNRTQILRNLIDLLPGQIDSFGYCLNNANSDQVIQQFDLNPLIDVLSALEAGSIPIHLGQTPEQFEKFKPSTNSTLNVADFKTVEALADRIKQIANDRVLYESMLAWKKEQFPERFEEILGYGKLHEACRIAKRMEKPSRTQPGAIRFILSTTEYNHGITPTAEFQRAANRKFSVRTTEVLVATQLLQSVLRKFLFSK